MADHPPFENEFYSYQVMLIDSFYRVLQKLLTCWYKSSAKECYGNIDSYPSFPLKAFINIYIWRKILCVVPFGY